MDRKARRRLFTELHKAGWRIKETAKGWKCFSPDGKHIVTVHGTMSEYRGTRNVLSEFKKAGFKPRV